MNVTVFCPNLIGDTVMATPAFRSLRRGFPRARLVAVIKPHVAATLDGAPWFDHVIRFDPRSRDRRHHTLAAIGALRRERPDIAVLFPNSYRSAIVAIASGARRRIGFTKGGRGFLLTDRLHAELDGNGRRVPAPIVESYLEIARRLGCPVESVRPELFTTAEDEATADRVWASLGLAAGEPVVCLNTGGAFGPAKSWPVSYFATLARRLATEDGRAVVVVCGPSERDAARAIVSGADHPRVHSLAEQALSIGLSKACIRRSALLITTDSGPRHFAAAFGVPVLTLFGPTHIAWTRTYHPHAAHLFHPVPCGPCQKPECPLGHHRCMRELTPETVYAAARRFL